MLKEVDENVKETSMRLNVKVALDSVTSLKTMYRRLINDRVAIGTQVQAGSSRGGAMKLSSYYAATSMLPPPPPPVMARPVAIIRSTGMQIRWRCLASTFTVLTHNRS